MRIIPSLLILSVIYSCSPVDVKNLETTGIRQFKNDSIEQAVITLNRVISATDTLPESFLYRGAAFKELEQYDKAIQDFSRLAEFDGYEATGLANRASVYYMQNDYQSALQDYTIAYQKDTTFASLLNPISHMLFGTGQRDKACVYYQKAIGVGDTTFNDSLKQYCDGKKYR